MSSTRPTASQLTESILGNTDNSALKSVFATPVEKTLDKFARELGSLRSLFEVQTIIDSEVVEPDGSIMKMIRNNIEKCVQEGLLTSKEEGSRFLAAYADLINKELGKIALDPKKYTASDKDTEAAPEHILIAKIEDLGRILRTQAMILAQPAKKSLVDPSMLPAFKKYDPDIETKAAALQEKVRAATKNMAEEFAKHLQKEIGNLDRTHTHNPSELQLSKLLHGCLDLLSYKSESKEPNPYKVIMLVQLFDQLNVICDGVEANASKKKEQLISTLKNIYQATYQDTVEHAKVAQIGKIKAENSDFLKNIQTLMKANGVSDQEIAQLKKPLPKASVEKAATPKPATQKPSERKSMIGALAVLFRPSGAEDKKALQKSAAAAKEQNELAGEGPSPIAQGGDIDIQFRSKISEMTYAWEVVQNLAMTKGLLDGKITLRQLYQLTNNIRKALQDSNQIGEVVDAVKHFNDLFKRPENNQAAQAFYLTKFIARTEALAGKVNQDNIDKGVKLVESDIHKFSQALLSEITLPPETKLYRTPDKAQRMIPLLQGCLIKTLSQLKHDPTITNGPDAKQKTDTALKALKERFIAMTNLLHEICPALMQLHAKFQGTPTDKAIIEKIHAAIVTQQLDPPRRHQDSFDTQKTYGTMRNIILAERSKASPGLQSELSGLLQKYDARFKLTEPKAESATVSPTLSQRVSR